jgi:hypothetical protein
MTKAYTSTFSAAMKASCGMSTLPNWGMRDDLAADRGCLKAVVNLRR